METFGIPAFKDNYIWCLTRGDRAVVVDPGEAAPVLSHLQQQRLSLAGILVTHHHADHIGGIEELLAHRPVPVFGPAAESIDAVDHPVAEGDRVDLPELHIAFSVLDVGGHTRGHVAYYGAKHLFCGDTLFAGGCGRIFEGTAAQMWRSLAKLAALPADTKVFCAHEYTQANLRFALAVEPDNSALAARITAVDALRRNNRPTVPSSLADELATNPFLRWQAQSVIAAAARYRGTTVEGDEAVFAAIREWKNVF